MIKHFLWIVPVVLIVRSAMAATPLAGCTNADYEMGKNFFDRVESLYSHGQISLSEFKSAEASFLDIELCAGKVTAADYCSRKSAVLVRLLEIFKAGGALSEQSAALSQLAALRTNCQ